MPDDLYHQDILDHYHHPDNFGELKNPDHTLTETNASCGDAFTFYVKLKPAQAHSGSSQNCQHLNSPGVGDIINAITFTGTGCAISTAACSMLTTHFIGKPLSYLKKLDIDFMQQLTHSVITPTRLKCLLLPAKALSQLIK